MGNDGDFRPDLHRGTARCYDRYRVRHPDALIDDLLARAQVSGRGRLLDLARGTGYVSFATHARFEEVWAVDREPDMTGLVRAKAAAAGIASIRLMQCRLSGGVPTTVGDPSPTL